MAQLPLTRPQISGYSVDASADYQALGTGTTDTLLLIGHADASLMFEPYKVVDMRQAVSFLGADPSSPLLRGMLEAYNAGCKDIWLFPAAPMSEYKAIIDDRVVADAGLGGQTFYERYFDRLTAAYSVLKEYDFYAVLTPLEAVHYDAGGVDFTTQLVNFCGDSFDITGSACLGVIGTRIPNLDKTAINALVNDARYNTYGENGRYVMVVVGEGIAANEQMNVNYSTPLSTQAAINLTLVPLTRSTVGVNFPGIRASVGRDFSPDELQSLIGVKINPAVRSVKGKRGYSYKTKLLTDNTLAPDDSDFWCMVNMKTVALCIDEIRDYGYQFIGTVGVEERLKESINNFLNLLMRNDMILSYRFDFRTDNRGGIGYVDVGVQPIYSISAITFSVKVGPGV